MNQPQSTPGPWTYIMQRGQFFVDRVGGDKERIAEVITAADARVIAGVPTMLKALETIRDAYWTDSETTGKERVVELQRIAGEAIKDVTGEGA